DVEKEVPSPRNAGDLADYAREIRFLELDTIHGHRQLRRNDGETWAQGPARSPGLLGVESPGVAESFPQNSWAVSGQVPAPLHFRMGCNRDDVSGSAKSSKPNLRHGDNARLPAGLLRPDGGAALTAGKQVFVVCPYEWTLAAHARWRAAKRPNG